MITYCICDEFIHTLIAGNPSLTVKRALRIEAQTCNNIYFWTTIVKLTSVELWIFAAINQRCIYPVIRLCTYIHSKCTSKNSKRIFIKLEIFIWYWKYVKSKRFIFNKLFMSLMIIYYKILELHCRSIFCRKLNRMLD